MQAYSIDAFANNLLEAPSFTPSSWTLDRALDWTRTRNPRTSSGAGARRRAAYEHQVDDHLALLSACDRQGVVVAVDRSARLRTGRAALRAARASAAELTIHTLEPWALLHTTPASSPAGLRALIARALMLVAWCRAYDPARAGWARATVRARTGRDTATSVYLPRGSWRAFVAWRRVVRALVALLIRIATWASRLIPLRRPAAPRPKAEEQQDAGRSRERSDRTTYRDQRATWRDVATRIEQLHFAM